MSKPIYFKLGKYNKIFEAYSVYSTSIEGTKLECVIFDSEKLLPNEILKHHYFSRNYSTNGGFLYLIEKGDMLYEAIKDTRLARKMYPLAIEHEGWLLIESH